MRLAGGVIVACDRLKRCLLHCLVECNGGHFASTLDVSPHHSSRWSYGGKEISYRGLFLVPRGWGGFLRMSYFLFATGKDAMTSGISLAITMRTDDRASDTPSFV